MKYLILTLYLIIIFNLNYAINPSYAIGLDGIKGDSKGQLNAFRSTLVTELTINSGQKYYFPTVLLNNYHMVLGTYPYDSSDINVKLAAFSFYDRPDLHGVKENVDNKLFPTRLNTTMPINIIGLNTYTRSLSGSEYFLMISEPVSIYNELSKAIYPAGFSVLSDNNHVDILFNEHYKTLFDMTPDPEANSPVSNIDSTRPLSDLKKTCILMVVNPLQSNFSEIYINCASLFTYLDTSLKDGARNFIILENNPFHLEINDFNLPIFLCDNKRENCLLMGFSSEPTQYMDGRIRNIFEVFYNNKNIIDRINRTFFPEKNQISIANANIKYITKSRKTISTTYKGVLLKSPYSTSNFYLLAIYNKPAFDAELTYETLLELKINDTVMPVKNLTTINNISYLRITGTSRSITSSLFQPQKKLDKDNSIYFSEFGFRIQYSFELTHPYLMYDLNKINSSYAKVVSSNELFERNFNTALQHNHLNHREDLLAELHRNSLKELTTLQKIRGGEINNNEEFIDATDYNFPIFSLVHQAGLYLLIYPKSHENSSIRIKLYPYNNLFLNNMYFVDNLYLYVRSMNTVDTLSPFKLNGDKDTGSPVFLCEDFYYTCKFFGFYTKTIVSRDNNKYWEYIIEPVFLNFSDDKIKYFNRLFDK